MKALILNSGVGRRMGTLTRKHPKCMTTLYKEHSILSWQLRLLRQVGITDVIITTGPFADALMRYTLDRLPSARFVHNPRYSETNYIYSMHLARELLLDDVILLHGDVVLEKSVLEELLSVSKSAVAVEHRSRLPKKDFKARLIQGRVREIGVDVFGEDCVASQPVYKLQRADMETWLEAVSGFCRRGETGVYAENALNTVFDRVEMFPMALEDRLCNEIDDAKDLAVISMRFRALINQAKDAGADV